MSRKKTGNLVEPLNFRVTSEMKRILVTIAFHPNQPFNGDVSEVLRQALEEYFDKHLPELGVEDPSAALAKVRRQMENLPRMVRETKNTLEVALDTYQPAEHLAEICRLAVKGVLEQSLENNKGWLAERIRHLPEFNQAMDRVADTNPELMPRMLEFQEVLEQLSVRYKGE